jgi:hypothetical protein
VLNKRRKVERRRSENAFSYGCCPLIALCWLTSFKHPSLHFCFSVVGYPLQIPLTMSTDISMQEDSITFGTGIMFSLLSYFPQS